MSQISALTRQSRPGLLDICDHVARLMEKSCEGVYVRHGGEGRLHVRKEAGAPDADELKVRDGSRRPDEVNRHTMTLGDQVGRRNHAGLKTAEASALKPAESGRAAGC